MIELDHAEAFLSGPVPKSLVWCGDQLVDWVAGGTRYDLNGGIAQSGVLHPYRFDAAVSTPDCEWAVIYERLGTKAVVLRNGQQVRELDRSYYCAHVTDYPICVWRESTGRALLAHCPGEYNQIELDDLESGERLTQAPERHPGDVFHSRLSVSPGGGWLLSAAWIWHPKNTLVIFNVQRALRQPSHLDGGGDGLVGEGFEATAACWQSERRVLVGGVDERDSPPDEGQGGALAIYDASTETLSGAVPLDEPPGELMPLGEDAAVVFAEYPRVVSLVSGETTLEWPRLRTRRGVGGSSGGEERPPIALDPGGRRFAVAVPSGIRVIAIR